MHLNIIGNFSGPNSELANAYRNTIKIFPSVTSYDIVTGPLQEIATGDRSRHLEARGVTFVAVPPPECLTAYARASIDGTNTVNIGLLTHSGTEAPWGWRDILRLCEYAEIWVPNRAAMSAIQMVSDIPVYTIPPTISATIPRQTMRVLPARDTRKFIFFAGHWAHDVVSSESLIATVDAYRAAVGVDDRTRLVICSPGASDALVTRCNRSGVILIRSEVLRSDFVQLLAGADAFISLCDSVELDLPVLEAMGQSVPVVCKRLACRGQYQTLDKMTPTAQCSAASAIRWVVDNRLSAVEWAVRSRKAALGLCGPEAIKKLISARLASLWVVQPR